MDNTNYYDFMTVKDLKNILEDLPDEMLVVIPVVDVDDVNDILAFRKVRTAGILRCEFERESEVVCLTGASDGYDIADQVDSSGKDISVVKVLYGKPEHDEVEKDA